MRKIDGIDSGNSAAAALRKRRIEDAVYKVQAQRFCEWSHELHRAVVDAPGAEVEPVERSVFRDHIQVVGAAINHRRSGDAIRTQECLLETARRRAYMRMKIVLPEHLASFNVEGKDMVVCARDIRNRTLAMAGGDVRGDHWRGQRAQLIRLILYLRLPFQFELSDVLRLNRIFVNRPARALRVVSIGRPIGGLQTQGGREEYCQEKGFHCWFQNERSSPRYHTAPYNSIGRPYEEVLRVALHRRVFRSGIG